MVTSFGFFVDRESEGLFLLWEVCCCGPSGVSKSAPAGPPRGSTSHLSRSLEVNVGMQACKPIYLHTTLRFGGGSESSDWRRIRRRR